MKLHKYSLNQLTDLALCVPEPGAVNFNILHVVLRTLLKQLDLGELKPWSESTVALAADTMRAGGKAKKKPKSALQLGGARSDDTASQSDTDLSDPISKGRAWKPPDHTEILGVTDEGKGKLVSELWQATHLTRRMDALEDGMEQLSTLMDDLLEEMKSVADLSERVERAVETVETFAEAIKNCVTKEELEEALKKFKEVLNVDALKDAIGAVDKKADELAKSIAEIKETIDKMSKDIEENLKTIGQKLDKLFEETDKLNAAVDKLGIEKADKTVVEEEFEKIHEELEEKVNRDEYEKKCEQIDAKLEEHDTKFEELDAFLKEKFEKIQFELDDKIDRPTLEEILVDYDERIKNLQENLKKLKEYIDKKLDVNAAGVTKCISCGRPSKPAGKEVFYSGDGRKRSKSCDPQERRFIIEGTAMSPYDPDSKAPSVISLPDADVIMKGMPNVKGQVFDNKETKTKNPAWNSLRRMQGSKVYRSTEPTRYVGGQHTITDPQQKGLQYTGYKVGTRISTEDMVLIGKDGEVYRGTVSKKDAKESKDKQREKEEQREKEKEAKNPPCSGGGPVDPPQKPFNTFSKTPIPGESEDKYLIGSDRVVHKGGSTEGFPDSKGTSPSKGTSSRPHIVDSSRTRPNVVTKTTASLMKNEVDLVGQDGRVYRGCIVQIPQNDTRGGSRSKLNRKQVYMS